MLINIRLVIFIIYDNIIIVIILFINHCDDSMIHILTFGISKKW